VLALATKEQERPVPSSTDCIRTFHLWEWQRCAKRLVVQLGKDSNERHVQAWRQVIGKSLIDCCLLGSKPFNFLFSLLCPHAGRRHWTARKFSFCSINLLSSPLRSASLISACYLAREITRLVGIGRVPVTIRWFVRFSYTGVV